MAPTSTFSLPLSRHSFVVSTQRAGKIPKGLCPKR
jgi:hypothetical protein